MHPASIAIQPVRRFAVHRLLLLAALMAAASISLHAEEGLIRLDALPLETQLGGLALSPDGTRAIVQTARRNFDDNRFDETLILLDLATLEQRDLTPQRDSVGQAAWSPDGRSLAFVAEGEEEKPQVFILPMAGGEARQLTQAEEGVADFQWAPDGRSVFYRSRDPAPEPPEGEERHNRSFEVGNNSYLTREAPRSIHIWNAPLAGGDAKRLTEGGESMMDLRVSPDGRTLAIEYWPTPHTGSLVQARIRLLDLETGEASELGVDELVQLRDFSPDGAFLAFGRPRGPEPAFNPNGIWLVSMADGTVIDATSEIDRNLGAVEWMPDSRSMLVTGTDLTRRVLWHVPLDGTPERIALDGVDVDIKLVSPAGELIVAGSEPNRPQELYRTRVGDWTLERLTDFNGELAGMNSGRVETVEWNGPDGFRQNGVLIYPPDFRRGTRYPLVLHIHGGPMGASTEGWSLFSQAMAAEGWLVFKPNYRGSSTQGRAFQTAVINDAGDGPGRDVMSGVEMLKARGIVDEDRIAVSGWSYGGYMTAWLTAHYNGWAAAVAGAAVTDWFDWYNMADLNVWAGYGLGGSPWLNDNAGNYWRQSPMAHAHRIRTPTLILSTTGDERVTVTQSYKLFHALKDNGVEVRFIAYPVPGHFPPDPVHQRDVYRRWIDWIKDHFESVED